MKIRRATIPVLNIPSLTPEFKDKGLVESQAGKPDLAFLSRTAVPVCERDERSLGHLLP